jgi:hypothetical protein
MRAEVQLIKCHLDLYLLEIPLVEVAALFNMAIG